MAAAAAPAQMEAVTSLAEMQEKVPATVLMAVREVTMGTSGQGRSFVQLFGTVGEEPIKMTNTNCGTSSAAKFQKLEGHLVEFSKVTKQPIIANDINGLYFSGHAVLEHVLQMGPTSQWTVKEALPQGDDGMQLKVRVRSVHDAPGKLFLRGLTEDNQSVFVTVRGPLLPKSDIVAGSQVTLTSCYGDREIFDKMSNSMTSLIWTWKVPVVNDEPASTDLDTEGIHVIKATVNPEFLEAAAGNMRAETREKDGSTFKIWVGELPIKFAGGKVEDVQLTYKTAESLGLCQGQTPSQILAALQRQRDRVLTMSVRVQLTATSRYLTAVNIRNSVTGPASGGSGEKEKGKRGSGAAASAPVKTVATPLKDPPKPRRRATKPPKSLFVEDETASGRKSAKKRKAVGSDADEEEDVAADE